MSSNSVLLQNPGIKQESACTNIQQYFQGKGPLYWKAEKVLSVVAPIFTILAVTLSAVGIGLVLGGLLNVGILAAIALPLFVCAIVTNLPRSSHQNNNLPFHSVSSKIDSLSLRDLVKWQGGDYDSRISPWRHTSWPAIIDFYQSLRTPEELAQRMQKENVVLKLNDLSKICKSAPLPSSLSQELRRQFMEQLKKGLIFRQIAQNYQIISPPSYKPDSYASLVSQAVISQSEFELLSKFREIVEQEEAEERRIEQEFDSKLSDANQSLAAATEAAYNEHYLNPNPYFQKDEHAQTIARLEAEKNEALAAIRRDADTQVAAIHASFEQS